MRCVQQIGNLTKQQEFGVASAPRAIATGTSLSCTFRDWSLDKRRCSGSSNVIIILFRIAGNARARRAAALPRPRCVVGLVYSSVYYIIYTGTVTSCLNYIIVSVDYYKSFIQISSRYCIIILT